MDSLDNQYGYWDRVALKKTFTHPLAWSRFKSLVPQQGRILDFGCGYGRTCHELYDAGFHNIIGVDTSGEMIERGRKTFPNLWLERINGQRLPFESKTFDAVILFAVLTCIPTNEGQEACITDMYRVLRPSGVIYISDYWIQDNDRCRQRYEAFRDKYGLHGVFELTGGGVMRHHHRVWLQSLLADFETIALFDIQVTTMNGNKALGFQYFGKKLEKRVSTTRHAKV